MDRDELSSELLIFTAPTFDLKQTHQLTPNHHILQSSHPQILKLKSNSTTLSNPLSPKAKAMDTTIANGTTPTDDDTPSRRPRDARLIHALLSSQGVTSYQERVPLMLIDFAYRYTRSVLADAQVLDREGYTPETTRGRGNKDEEGVSGTSLRLAVASRAAGQLQPGLGKQDLLEMGQETNRIGLPRVERDFGVRLPEERFLLTGNGFSLQEEWMEEEEINEEGPEGEKSDETMLDQPGDEDEGGVLLGDEMEEDEFEEVMGIRQDNKMSDD
jgi:transcription initiation factor TFIID subunit 9B